MIEAVLYVRSLIRKGRKVGVFSCEDPYNTPFHRDLLNASDGYFHLVPRAGARVARTSLDLGLQKKGINAWGIMGHYGVVEGHEVCAAIGALNGDYKQLGPDLSRAIGGFTQYFEYDPAKSLRENVINWVKCQYELLLEIVTERQRTLPGSVQGDIVIFGGLVENSPDGKDYDAQILFSNNGLKA